MLSTRFFTTLHLVKQQLDEDQFALDRDKYFDEMREKYGEAVGNVQDNLDKQAEALFNPDDRTVKDKMILT